MHAHFWQSILFFDLWCKGVDDRKQLLIVSEPLKHIEMIGVGYIATVLILKCDYTLAYDYNIYQYTCSGCQLNDFLYCSNHLFSAYTSLNRTTATLLLPVQQKVFIFQGKWN